MVRREASGLSLLLAHPGGPFFAKKDDGAWTIPKGLVDGDEDPLAAARREFVEETGFTCGEGPFVPLGDVRMKGGKIVRAWAFAGTCEPGELRSNTFELEWPPRSGKRRAFPEIDRAAFFTPEEARRKILAAQAPFIERALALFDAC
jgi:predicted NUDIX family NTP pyrophosphohydrolase